MRTPLEEQESGTDHDAVGWTTSRLGSRGEGTFLSFSFCSLGALDCVVTEIY